MKLTKEIGLMLYWAEGDKTKNYFVALTNTDPKILFYFISWLRKYYKVDETRIKCRLYLWNDSQETSARKFWSKLLSIPLNQFTKSCISKNSSTFRKKKHIYGVCRVSYGSKKVFTDIIKDIEKEFNF